MSIRFHSWGVRCGVDGWPTGISPLRVVWDLWKLTHNTTKTPGREKTAVFPPDLVHFRSTLLLLPIRAQVLGFDILFLWIVHAVFFFLFSVLNNLDVLVQSLDFLVQGNAQHASGSSSSSVSRRILSLAKNNATT